MSLTITFYSKSYYFNKWLGVVMERNTSPVHRKECQENEKLSNSFEKVMNPYLLKSQKRFGEVPYYNNIDILYAKLLVILCKRSFILALLLSKIRIVRFNDAVDAISVFRDIFPKHNQKTLCLPRSLFAASASREFRRSGVLFIGVFLPSRHMHAWLIENDSHPDNLDDIWICYQPVATII